MCLGVLELVYRAMSQHIARYYETDNESYRAMLCNLFKKYCVVSDILHRLLYFVVSLLLAISISIIGLQDRRV